MRTSTAVLFPTLCVTLLLSGCTYIHDCFVVNDTDQPVDLTISLRKPIHLITNMDFTLPLRYADTILTIDNSTQERLTGQLAYSVQDSVTLTLTIPPHTTTLLGRDGNGFRHFDSLRFSSGMHSVAVNEGTIMAEQNRIETGVFSPRRFVLRLRTLLTL